MEPCWTDLVFHVLAHVARSAHLPASVWNPEYVAFVERELGPAEQRELGRDALLLAEWLDSHERLAAVQCVAFLHPTLQAAARAAPLELQDLVASSDNDAAVLRLLLGSERIRDAAELLRCAAALERPHYLRLSFEREAAPEWARLRRATTALRRVAPLLSSFSLRGARALGRRGRVVDDRLWLGVPGTVGGPSIAHAAWQAAHEATVAEVAVTAAAGTQLSERAVEHVALAVLAARARRAQLEDAHGAWLATIRLPPALRPGAALDGLDAAERAVATVALERALGEPEEA